jgi:dipeptidyl aminopeptidase/acylaminoacyl peptidase
MSSFKLKQFVFRLIILLSIAGGLSVIMMMNTSEKEGTSPNYIGRSEISVTDGHMTPEVLLSFGRLSDPQVSPDGEHILYGVSYTSVEQNRSCRNLFICKLDGSENTQITFEGKSINNARWIEGGKKLIYLQGGQVYTEEINLGKKGWKLSGKKQITDVAAGVGEFKLSSAEDMIMYISYVKSHVDKPVDVYADLDKATAYSTSDLMYRHWDHWVEEIPHTYIAPLDVKRGKIGESTDLLEGAEGLYELPTEPFGGLEQLCWSPDGKYIVYSCRKKEGKDYAFSTNTGIYSYCVETRETKGIKTDGGYDTEPCFSPDGSKLCWISMEREGYEADKQRILMCDVSWNGGKMDVSAPVELTSNFKYNAAGITWYENSKGFFFNALTEGLQAIYRADLVGGQWYINRITGADLWYDFDSPFYVREVEGVTELLTSYRSMDFPNELVCVKVKGLKEGVACMVEGCEDCFKVEPITKENEHILSQLAEHKTEARYVKTVDGKDMLTWVLFPPDFDPNKKYPSILICLGGPQGTLSQGWSYRWNYRLMASQGYVVVLPNRRGTTAFGQEWCEQISGDYCGLNIQDYLSAARSVKAEPYIDKMAACGASYGGFSVYYLCGNHENTFDAFIAHAGIFNQEHMYMTTEELWFPTWDNGGAPWDKNPTAKRHYANSAHKFIKNWHTPLMVIHGAMDFRVPLDQGMAAFNAAQMMGVPSKMLVFPDENHWILKPQNAMFWHREYFDWLDKWCK